MKSKITGEQQYSKCITCRAPVHKEAKWVRNCKGTQPTKGSHKTLHVTAFIYLYTPAQLCSVYTMRRIRLPLLSMSLALNNVIGIWNDHGYRQSGIISNL